MGIPQPAKHIAIVTCMDARIDVLAVLGLGLGDAHVIRNAGGVVTDDVVRSLIISQRLLGTRQIIVMHHTECGMLTFTDDALKAQIESETGLRPPFAMEAFPDLDKDVLQSLARIAASPFIAHKDHLRGLVYDVMSGQVRQVQPLVAA